MSIKTLRKRIALVAVSALGVGLLSVAPASAAVTATASIDRNTFDWSTSVSNTTGQCKVISDDAADSNQVGEILAAGGVFALAVDGTVADVQMDVLNDSISFVISGSGRWDTFTADSDAPATVSYVSEKNWTFTATNLTNADSAPTLIKGVATGAGSIQVSVVVNDGGTSTTIERYTLTASTTCVTGKASVDNSLIKVAYYATAVTAGAASISNNITETTAADTTANSESLADRADKISNGGTAYIAFSIKDGTSAASQVTAGPGIFTASATNGAAVGWGAASSTSSSSATTTVANGSNQAQTLYVTQGDANEDKPVSTVVSLYYNNVLYGTRTITFTGKPTKIEIIGADSSIGAAGLTSKYVLVYEITDSAGNKLTTAGAGISGASGATGDDNTPIRATTGHVVDTTQAIVTAVPTINTEASGYVGTANVTCGSGSGTAKVYLKYVFSNLTSLKSNEYDFACGYAPVNYKASLDKASYQPGEIATLTITATDKNGKTPYDLDDSAAGNDLGSTAKPVSISLPQMTAVTTPTNVDEFVNGTKTYKFTVGTTEGSYSGVVSLPLYNSTTYGQAAQTVTYKVASAPTGAVTNAEVLAAIVKLIASINKQIRALQKSLRR